MANYVRKGNTKSTLGEIPEEDQMENFLRRSQKDPVWFCENVLGRTLWPKQEEILKAIRDHRKVTVRSCNGAGKCEKFDSNIILYDGTIVKAHQLLT